MYGLPTAQSILHCLEAMTRNPKRVANGRMNREESLVLPCRLEAGGVALPRILAPAASHRTPLAAPLELIRVRSFGTPETVRPNDRVDPSKYVCSTVISNNSRFRMLYNDSVTVGDFRSLTSSREVDVHYLFQVGLLES